MTKIGEPLTQTYEDSGFDEFMNKPFEGLGSANLEFQETTGYTFDDLVINMESLKSKSFTTTIAFTSSDYRTVTWAEGIVEYQDTTTTPTIASGTTGNMAARTYIYYDSQASKVVLQTTTTAGEATKGERILLAIAINNANTSGNAEVQTFGATGVYVANLTAEHITSGTIRSKTITLDVNAGEGDVYIAAGKTDFTNTDPGFILGVDDSDSDKAKFFIGDSSKYLNWDGSGLTVQGVIKDGGGTNLIDSTGLISSANFASDSGIDESVSNTSSTSFSDMGTASATFTTANDNTRVLLMGRWTGRSNNVSGAGIVYFDLDGSEVANSEDRFWFNGLYAGQAADLFNGGSYTMMWPYVISSAGEHTLKMRIASNNASYTIYYEDVVVFYLVLGK